MKDTVSGKDVTALSTTLRVLWSDSALYLGYEAPYTELTTFDNGGKAQRRIGLWEKDVLEVFLAVDEKPSHYAEFEWAPNGDWLDVECGMPHCALVDRPCTAQKCSSLSLSANGGSVCEQDQLCRASCSAGEASRSKVRLCPPSRLSPCLRESPIVCHSGSS